MIGYCINQYLLYEQWNIYFFSVKQFYFLMFLYFDNFAIRIILELLENFHELFKICVKLLILHFTTSKFFITCCYQEIIKPKTFQKPIESQ